MAPPVVLDPAEGIEVREELRGLIEDGVEGNVSSSMSFLIGGVTGLAEEGVDRTVSSSSGLVVGAAEEGVESTVSSSVGATESVESNVSTSLGFVAGRVVAPCRARLR